MRKAFVPTVMAAALLAQPAVAQKSGKTIQCWTDESGRRACGDRVPPQYAKQERQVVNERGLVVDTKARERTPQEIEAERRAAELDAELKRREEERRAHDQFLLQTYRSVKDLEATRSDRVTTLDARIRLVGKAIADGEAALKSLHEQAEAARKGGKEPEPKLAAQIREFEKSLAENRKAAELLRQERDKTIAAFDADIARYRELKPGT
ncbi:MAG: hypothetical protein HYV18_01935 [Gammaproteobacteria bacterium]|nr:hypothetical protein [Gammaproteobacteria bacterium]